MRPLALPFGSAPLDGGESGSSRRGRQFLFRNRRLRHLSDNDVDPDERLRDDFGAGGGVCEAVDGAASVLVSGEGDQGSAPLGYPRPPEGDELGRLTLVEPQDGELLLQETGGRIRIDNKALILSEGGGLLPLPEQ